ncbi:MAG: amidohydrolase [Acetivibrio sp.]
MKTLLKHGSIIAWENGPKEIRNGYLGIDGDKIIYIGKQKPEEVYDIEKDMTKKLLIPGLINGHSHSPMTLLRGEGSELPLKQWLDCIVPIENRMEAEDIRRGSQVAMLEMIAGGTTCFSDMYIMPEITIEEVCKAKMKANVTRCIVSFDPKERAKDNFGVAESLKLFEDFNNYMDGRIKVDFSIHGEYTSTPGVIQEYSEMCEERKGRMHLHLSETPYEHKECIKRYGKTPTQWFYDLGTFNVPTQAAHGVMLTDNDLELLKEKGVAVVHNPSSNMKLGSGFAPIKKMLEKGILLAMGTDGAASNNNLNMFEELHIASIIHKGKEQDPTLLSPAELFTFATRNGAKIQGREDTGTLEVGKKADIVAVSLDRPHMVPNRDLLSTLIYSAQAQDVFMTMIDGEILYENGIYYTLDAEKIMFEFEKRIESLY